MGWDASLPRAPGTQVANEHAVEEIVEDARARVVSVLVEQRTLLDNMASLLVIAKTINSDDIRVLMSDT